MEKQLIIKTVVQNSIDIRAVSYVVINTIVRFEFTPSQGMIINQIRLYEEKLDESLSNLSGATAQGKTFSYHLFWPICHNLSETVPSLKEKVPPKLTRKQKDAMLQDKIEPETDLNGNVIVPRYNCVTSHTARRPGITNMYLSHKYTILQMMHVSGHKTQKTFMDYIKLSSEEIADEIASMSKKESDMW